MARTEAHALLASTTFLEYAFLRWVLSPAVAPELLGFVTPQREVPVAGHRYLVDYEIAGSEKVFAVELDGYGPHSGRSAFSYDRMRQNDLHAAGRVVARFSYDSIRTETARCVEQLQTLLLGDPLLRDFLIATPRVEEPEMAPDPLHALDPSPVTSNGRLRPVPIGDAGAYFAGCAGSSTRRP